MKLNLKLNASKTIEENFLLIVMLFSITYKQVLFDVSILNKFPKKSFLIDMAFFCVIFFILKLISKKNLLISYIILLVTSLLMMSNSIFYRCYGELITIGIFKEITFLSSVESSVLSFFHIIDLLYIIDLPLIYYVFRSRKCNKIEEKLDRKKYIKSLSISVLSFMVLFVYTGLGSKGLLSGEWSRDDLYKSYGFMLANVVDDFNYIKGNINFKIISNEQKQNDLKQLNWGNFEYGQYKGKNLIMIQVESLQEFVINRKYNGKEITPNLNKFIGESAYFDNCYYQISLGHTSDAEFLTNNSLYPLKDSSLYMTKYNNTFNALPQVMDDNGYNTFAIHGNKASFWNRGIIYNKYGFNNFYSLEKLKDNDTIAMGLSDRSFLNQSIDIINKSKQPFYSFMITLTSHGPFDVNNNFCKGTDTISKYYNAINYTDKCLGEFIDKLKKNGVLDNSILVVYGDHNAMTIGDKKDFCKVLNKNLNNDYNWQAYQKIPLIMRFPNGQNKGINHNSVGQVDVMPTIAKLYGLGKINYLGENLFDNKNHLVVLRDGSYVYGNEYYDSNKKSTYNLENGHTIINNLNRIKEVNTKLNISDDIIKYNLFKK